VLSGQKFQSDLYESPNSPFDYFYAHANKTQSEHTFIDLKENRDFKCDCKLFQVLDEYSYLKVLVDCTFKNDPTKNCPQKPQSASTKTTTTTAYKTQELNKKLKFLFILTCLILVIFSFSLVFYMCSDFFKNFTYVDQVRGIIRRKIDQLKFENNKESNTGVQYSKLLEDAAGSTMEINA
jgi:hypothetical protein